ncbi:methionine biosynthesis protein MetW [Alcaligenes endophyticus]|uniref:Methionine biosynthesis protein MetW n=1 Tax=Alcaligenes endophyticus TaxID=1929088 RepID=A0ABT8EG59_9BURK|nr:methionine biosynthesis protein MetW [Alcaligenes endophyticus]MCX5590055.1 methionine biosynthesis protein MetW [Alcaligenes endophyticus]MDN4120282.1 methionine biosynthesis protein MetW [Alcaligenes endophyticus]
MSSAVQKPISLRQDLQRIAQWIEPGSRVLDLGCSDGELLAYLRDHKHTDGTGVELDDYSVIASVKRGVPVIQQNLEEGLALFADQHFDTVVLSKTLQSMLHTEHILREMARVAHYGIVSFPNFGYWPHGWAILRGRMPVTGEMPYQWYDTPNIHLCTLKDFQDLAASLGLRITHRAAFNDKAEVSFMPGWRSTLAVYRFESPYFKAA